MSPALEYQNWNLGWAKVAWSNLFGPWVMDAAMFVQDARGKFNAIETLGMLHKYPISTLCAPPMAQDDLGEDSQGRVARDGTEEEIGEVMWTCTSFSPLLR